MPAGYHHLTYEDRCQIYALTQSGLSQAAIARQLGVDRSTIKRELDRNTGARGYRFKQAQEKASQRRRTASCAPREAGARNIDRGKTDAGAVEPRSDRRLAGEKWRPFDQPRAHLPACLGRQEKRRKPLCPAASPR